MVPLVTRTLAAAVDGLTRLLPRRWLEKLVDMHTDGDADIKATVLEGALRCALPAVCVWVDADCDLGGCVVMTWCIRCSI